MTPAPGSTTPASGRAGPSPADRAPQPAPESDGPRIGDLLVAEGAITREELKAALTRQRGGKKRLGEVLVEMEVLSPQQLLAVLGEALRVPAVTLRHGLCDPALLTVFGPEACRSLRALPLFRVHDEMTVAMAEPQSLPAVDRLAAISGCRIRPVLALEGEIEEYTGRYASTGVDVGAFLSQLAKTDVQQDVEVVDQEARELEVGSTLERMVEGSPIVNLVNVALLSAIQDGASDIHIEPAGRATRIRYRMDGVLRELMSPPPGMHAAIVSPGEGDRPDGHRREAAAPGGPRAPQGRGPRHRPPRELDAHAARREAGDPRARQAEPPRADGGAGADEGAAGHAAPRAPPAARAHAGHRAHRQRQDHDALLGAGPAAQPRPRT